MARDKLAYSRIAMAHKVFISYASADKGIADAVCLALEGHGINCWYAPRDVPYGQDFDEAIVDAICASRLMILILSSHSNKSAHVKREIQNACMDDARVPILPFRVEDLPLNKALRYYIGAVHWLDAVTPPLESHLKNLVQHVEARLPRTAQLPALTEPEARPESPLTALDAPPQSESLQAPDEKKTQSPFEANLVQENPESISQAYPAREDEEARRVGEEEARRRDDEVQRQRLEPKELKRKQQEAEEDGARKATENADKAAKLEHDQQDALLRPRDEVQGPGKPVEAQPEALALKGLNQTAVWGLLAILIGSFVTTLISNSGIPVAVGFFAICPIFCLYLILRERRIRSGKKTDSRENKNS